MLLLVCQRIRSCQWVNGSVVSQGTSSAHGTQTLKDRHQRTKLDCKRKPISAVIHAVVNRANVLNHPPYSNPLLRATDRRHTPRPNSQTPSLPNHSFPSAVPSRPLPSLPSNHPHDSRFHTSIFVIHPRFHRFLSDLLVLALHGTLPSSSSHREA
jgi:hypothetical protein